MSKIDPTTGDAEVVFPDGSAERVRREVSVDPDTGEKEFSFISLDRPDPDFPVDVGAPLLLGSTKETAIRRLTKVREAPPVEPVRRITPEELAERRVAEREASEIGKIRTAQRNVKRKNALIGRGVSVIAFNLKSIYIPYVLQDIKNNNYFYLQKENIYHHYLGDY